jgi:hypothetical protein
VGVEVIQIAPQMRILVAIEAVDGRKGIDSLALLCQEKLEEDPFSGCLFVFRSRRGTSIRNLTYDGQGSGWQRSGSGKDGLYGGRVARSRPEGCKPMKRSCYWRRVTRRRQQRLCGGG